MFRNSYSKASHLDYKYNMQAVDSFYAYHILQLVKETFLSSFL